MEDSDEEISQKEANIHLSDDIDMNRARAASINIDSKKVSSG